MSSCEHYNIDDNNIYGYHSPNLTRGQNLFDINKSNLSKSFFEKLKIIDNILNDVRSNKESAKLFIEDTDEYLKKNKINFSLTLNDYERNVILALSKKEILSAYRNNDFERFIELCRENGYLKEVRLPKSEIRTFFKTDGDYNKYLDLYDEKAGGESELIPTFLIYPIAVAVAVAAFDVVGVALVAVYTETVFWGVETRSITRGILKKEPILNLWLDSENVSSLNSEVLHNEFIDRRVNLLIELLQRNDTDKVVNIEKIRRMITKNLEIYYGIN